MGLDIVPQLIEGNKANYVNESNMSFKQQDFINEPFPHQPDLILCRDMIQHNSLVDGVRAYYNMERSGAKYLATTWHQQGASPASVCALQGDPFQETPSGSFLCRVLFVIWYVLL